MFMTFHGKTRLTSDQLSHVHESPAVMMVPLILLAVGALGAGMAFKSLFIGDGQLGFWGAAIFTNPENTILVDLKLVPKIVIYAPLISMILGFITAWYFYIKRPDVPVQLAKEQDILYRFLLNKWYFDELYDVIFVRPAKWLARQFWKIGDGLLIDGFGPDGVAAQVQRMTQRIVKLQSGYVYHYAFAMLLGVAGLASWFMLTGGH